uniref:NAC domain-containing protein n=1 Tax=Triticum urartu TaxID=4572 RepID=A0A8R7UD08_TRIUA
MVELADVLGLTRGYKLQPHDDEVVEYYLLRRLLGRELTLEGIILEDDPLSAPPWELLNRHGREDDAFFFAHGQTIDGKGSRNKRTCAGGGCWEGQKVIVDDKQLIVPDSGMEITWKKYHLKSSTSTMTTRRAARGGCCTSTRSQARPIWPRRRSGCIAFCSVAMARSARGSPMITAATTTVESAR